MILQMVIKLDLGWLQVARLLFVVRLHHEDAQDLKHHFERSFVRAQSELQPRADPNLADVGGLSAKQLQASHAQEIHDPASWALS